MAKSVHSAGNAALRGAPRSAAWPPPWLSRVADSPAPAELQPTHERSPAGPPSAPGPAGPPPDPLDLVVGLIARRRGIAPIEIDGGRMFAPAPAGPPWERPAGPPEAADSDGPPPGLAGADHGDRGPRDVRRGDRWLPWHFTAEFEDRMRRER
jgi:hypothetical protein